MEFGIDNLIWHQPCSALHGCLLEGDYSGGASTSVQFPFSAASFSRCLCESTRQKAAGCFSWDKIFPFPHPSLSHSICPYTDILYHDVSCLSPTLLMACFTPRHPGVCFGGMQGRDVLALHLIFMGLGYFSETPLLSLAVSCSWGGLTPSITAATSAGSTSHARPTGRSTWMRKCSFHPTTCMGICAQTAHTWGWAETLPKKKSSSFSATHPR